jgi:hypothetical protein
MATLTGTIKRAFEHRSGRNQDTGKRWSNQRFILETEEGDATCVVWNQRDLEESRGHSAGDTGFVSRGPLR